jgi:hypothetical protein
VPRRSASHRRAVLRRRAVTLLLAAAALVGGIAAAQGHSGGGGSASTTPSTGVPITDPATGGTENVDTGTLPATTHTTAAPTGKPVAIEWAGDMVLGSSFGMPPEGGRGSRAAVVRTL